MKEKNKNVMDHLTTMSGKIKVTRDYIRVAGSLVNDHVESQGFEEMPMELVLAMDLLEKVDRKLEYYDISLCEDLKILQGELQ